jgi:membrane associated rhomboid family serine protease
MIIPWGTDAPIYHRPVATITIMLVNVLVFLTVPPDIRKELALVLGEGLHPIQWLTNTFLHTGIFQLVGNMIFLWTFGLVVEGKLGWWRFSLVYLLLGIVESAGMQILVSSEPPISMAGATTVIFGLLAMCLVWAPRNEVTCIVWLRFSPMEFDLSILWFAAMYIVFDIFSGALSGVIRASLTNLSPGVILALALNQTVGAILGFVVAVVLLKFKLVDCENWDLFAVMERRAGRPKGSDRKTKTASRRVASEFQKSVKTRRKTKHKDTAGKAESVDDASAFRLRLLRQHIELGEEEAALSVYDKARRSAAGWQLPESDWRDLVELLLKNQLWEDSVRVMRDYLRELPEPSIRVRLKLAQILIHKQGRPLQALKILAEIPESSLPENLETIRSQLVRQAEAVREEGPLELDEDLR